LLLCVNCARKKASKEKNWEEKKDAEGLNMPENEKINFDPPASLRKWPSLRRSGLEADAYCKRDDGERRPVRATRKFKSEAEAKQFAQEMIKGGWSAIAGTLNPHTPKKTVASTQILDWIAGKH
jgi:hypothetical protein